MCVCRSYEFIGSWKKDTDGLFCLLYFFHPQISHLDFNKYDIMIIFFLPESKFNT